MAKKKSNNAVTIESLRKYQDELKLKFGNHATVAYPCVRMTQLSVARYYGGCKVNGFLFIYNPTDDSLIREDVVKWVLSRERRGRAKPVERGQEST